MRDFDDGAFGIAVKQDIGFGIDKDRAAHFVGPIVVMRDAPQRTFDAAEHDRHIFVGFAATLRVNDS